nr:MAG TPA: hypothetical protein [Siphoviridae sp. ctqOv4]
MCIFTNVLFSCSLFSKDFHTFLLYNLTKKQLFKTFLMF